MPLPRSPRPRPVALLAIVIALFFPAQVATAHPGFSAIALLKIDPHGRLTLRLRHDALAFALNETPADITDPPMLEFLDAPEEMQRETFADATDRLAALTALTADAHPIALEIIEHPTPAALHEWLRQNPERRLPVKLDFDLRAELPTSARSFWLRFPKVLGDVIITIDRPGHEPLAFPLRPGEATPPLELTLSPITSPISSPIAPASAPASSNTSPSSASSESPQSPTPLPTPLATPLPTPLPAPLPAPITHLSTLNIAARYTALGFTHIIPHGTDHALFILTLFLLTPRVKPLLWPITAFTIAHSVTLTLTTLHLLTLPAFIIEPTIAASIAFMAIENLATRKHTPLTHARSQPLPLSLPPWRPVVAFIFGLVHGMGFASALGEIGLPTSQLITGLVAFNLGVECGHLTVLAVAFLLLGWFRDTPWYRTRIAVPLSIAIALIALFWLIQRLSGPG